MTKQSVLILGARSDMARAIAHRYGAEGYPLILAARDSARLTDDRADLQLRYGVEVALIDYDALQPPSLIDRLDTLPGTVICAVGAMGQQRDSETDMDEARTILRSNFEGPALTLAEFAEAFEARGSGAIIGIASVAGLRGRATNYTYGAAKAGMVAFLSGLRNRLDRKGVQVITVLPGFVATRMTEGMDLPARLTAEPSEVANAIWRAQSKGRDIIYIRPIWRWIMTIIRAIPERVFKRLNI